MPIQPINYAAMPVAEMGVPNMAQAFASGIQAGALPRHLKQQQEQAKLANALAAIKLQYAPQMSEAELVQLQNQGALTGQQAMYYGPDIQSQIGLRGAQTNLANQQASLPYGGHTLPGIGGDILALEGIKKMFGENSEQYKRALDAFNLTQQSTASRIGYQDVLAQTMPLRSLTPTGKSIVEQSNVATGAMPSGQPWGYTQNGNSIPPEGVLSTALKSPISGDNKISAPGSPEELANQYGLLRQKNTSDIDTRKRNLFATNIEKTLDNINVDDLTVYGGLQGNAKLKKDQLLASIGKQTPEYEKFMKNVTAADILSSQIRQFYGESIQPEMRKKLELLTNPASWTNNPKIAKEMFNQTKNILGQEMQTYRDALTSTKAYQQLQPQAAKNYAGAELQQMAQQAIAAGANPEQVNARIQQMLMGAK